MPQEELVKYEASATHQEILAGAAGTDVDRQHVFGFVRRPSTVSDPRLKELKSYLLPGNLAEFDRGDTIALCDAVFDRLRKVIEGQVQRFADLPAVDLEVEAHNRFAAERTRIFAGREDVLATIADYLHGPERRPLVLLGEPGSGKSSVMAKASQQSSVPARVIRRFIGASPESASGHALLASLCREIAPGDVPVDYAQLGRAFRERLARTTADQPLALFLDALDQLSPTDPARDLTWFPPQLPPHVKVVVSTIGPGELLAGALRVHLGTMTRSEAGQALTGWLQEAHRTLQTWQREKVLEHFERCGLPLYLKLAADESCLWKSYAPEAACTLGEGVAGIVDTFIDRLSSNANHGPVLVERSLGYLAAARYGLTEEEVLDVLTADDAVWTDFDQRKHHEVSERRLPVVVWSRLSLDLEPYLAERAAPGGAVIAFYHRQLPERVAARFRKAATYHKKLAAYFDQRPNWVGPEFLPVEPGKPDSRKAVELPWQRHRARQPVRLARLLGDIGFLEAKIGAGLSRDLLDDFEKLDGLCSRRQEQELFRETLLLWRVLGNVLDQVAADPASLGMQIGLELQNIGAAAPPQPREASLLRRLDAATRDRPCFSRVRGGTGVPYLAQTAMLEAFLHLVRFSPDGRELVFADAEGRLVRWKWSAPVLEQTQAPTTDKFCGSAMMPDGSIAFGGPREVWMFSTECLWDERFRSGTWRQVTASEGGTRLGAVAASPSGMLLVGQSGSGAARILRFRGNEPVKPLRMPYSERDPDLSSIAVSANDQIMAAGFTDGTLAISTGFRGVIQQGALRACAFLDGDSAVASVGDQGVLSIRDLSGQLRREVPLVHGPASCLAYSAPRKVVAVGHQNGYVSLVRLHESDSRLAPGFWPGVRGGAASLDFSDSGQYLAAGGSEGVVRVFEVDSVERAGEPRSLGERGSPAGAIRDVSFVNARQGLAFLDRRQRLRTNSADSDSRYFPFGAQCFCYDPVRDRLVAAREDEIYFLDPATGKVESQVEGHSTEPRVMAMSADGRSLALREDTRLLIYDVRKDGAAIERRIELFLTPLLYPATQMLNRAPLRFCRNGALLACPLESAGGTLASDLLRTLLLVDTANGGIKGRVPYRGFCAALDELPEEDILILGLGRGDVGEGPQRMVVPSPDDALLFCSISTGERLQSRRLSPEDLGVTGIAVERESNFKGCIVVACESGRVRLTSLHSPLWAASICLPDPAAAIRFSGGAVQVGDNGCRQGHWPAIHEFTLHFPIWKKGR